MHICYVPVLFSVTSVSGKMTGTPIISGPSSFMRDQRSNRRRFGIEIQDHEEWTQMHTNPKLKNQFRRLYPLSLLVMIHHARCDILFIRKIYVKDTFQYHTSK